eukprot:CAMPEP_0115761148 /NCGR_PEP_ID=MMETSP0272-20121206/100358_1 /TAXON_ID=71861 /ORGANISM="Scrippsiella trochoidea, Strain CCMP3099" /LENGTH=262 /DNA_ID=CAMNT_0003206821 /DNA_START=252 /DNA_END=1040 /DNA_ORIENTATION=-
MEAPAARCWLHSGSSRAAPDSGRACHQHQRRWQGAMRGAAWHPQQMGHLPSEAPEAAEAASWLQPLPISSWHSAASCCTSCSSCSSCSCSHQGSSDGQMIDPSWPTTPSLDTTELSSDEEDEGWQRCSCLHQPPPLTTSPNRHGLAVWPVASSVATDPVKVRRSASHGTKEVHLHLDAEAARALPQPAYRILCENVGFYGVLPDATPPAVVCNHCPRRRCQRCCHVGRAEDVQVQKSHDGQPGVAATSSPSSMPQAQTLPNQ